MLKTPVAFFIFNRPKLTNQVFESIASQRPEKLLIVADGPRGDRPGELEKCKEAQAVIKKVDWNCEVLTNISDVNLGCRNRLTTGLNWVFDKVEQAIVLEDDCVPDPSFYLFCSDLLEKYKNDDRIFQISGANLQNGNLRGDYSYYFSKINNIWGWATWRRAWKKHDVEMKAWPQVKNSGLLSDLGDSKFVSFWQQRFDEAYSGIVDTWDYQWVFTTMSNHGLSIVPNVNLIKNIGFGSDATHTINSADLRNSSATQKIELPLKHPPYVLPDIFADSYDMNQKYQSYLPGKPFAKRIINTLNRFF